jgi:formylglycine-generating enzyme required for sulfatase activity
MGNVAAADEGPANGNVSRLVVMSPYYLDATEMTVGAYRAQGGGNDAAWSGETGCDPQDYCTYTASPGKNDGLPITCVNWDQARAVCQKLGKDLPTEAQFEYAASGLSGQPYVWGTDVPECAYTVFERGGFGYAYSYPDECVSLDTNEACNGSPAGGLGLGGPLPPMSGPRDQLTIALPGWTGTIFDLVANVAELTRDQWDPENGPCWSRTGVYTDPLCSDPAATDVTARGGDWTSGPVALLAATRQDTLINVIGPYLGFRCARSP